MNAKKIILHWLDWFTILELDDLLYHLICMKRDCGTNEEWDWHYQKFCIIARLIAKPPQKH